MCPSYMATREEADSTRGRANVLRLAMAGRLGESGLGDEGVRSVLELCLECRACKAECPVGVDVARFKSEFLADYWKRHGTSARARVLGHVHEMARWGSRLAPLSNWIVRSAPSVGQRAGAWPGPQEKPPRGRANIRRSSRLASHRRTGGEGQGPTRRRPC
jgi:Fe-S oxidoreductase